MWCVLDFETTGLDPRSDIILECAVGLVEPKTLEVLDQQSWVVWGYQTRSMMDDFVLKMHTDNGLLAAIDALQCREAAKDTSVYTDHPQYMRDLDACLEMWSLRHRQDEKDKIVLLGNSIHFDRRFIEENLPRSYKLLHHRMIDASGPREAYREWVGEPPTQDKAHRAWEDCLMSLNGLRWLRGLMQHGAVRSENYTKEAPR